MYYACRACDSVIKRDEKQEFGLTLTVCTLCQVERLLAVKPARPAWLSMQRMDMGQSGEYTVANPTEHPAWGVHKGTV